MKREKALALINDLPKEFDVEELVEKMLFMDKVEKGLEQIEQGKTISHEELQDKVREWQK